MNQNQFTSIEVPTFLEKCPQFTTSHDSHYVLNVTVNMWEESFMPHKNCLWKSYVRIRNVYTRTIFFLKSQILKTQKVFSIPRRSRNLDHIPSRLKNSAGLSFASRSGRDQHVNVILTVMQKRRDNSLRSGRVIWSGMWWWLWISNKRFAVSFCSLLAKRTARTDRVCGVHSCFSVPVFVIPGCPMIAHHYIYISIPSFCGYLATLKHDLLSLMTPLLFQDVKSKRAEWSLRLESESGTTSGEKRKKEQSRIHTCIRQRRSLNRTTPDRAYDDDNFCYAAAALIGGCFYEDIAAAGI